MTRAAAGVRAVVALTLVVVLAACGSPAPAPATDPTDLAERVSVDDVFGHLQRLADIAEANDGTRADGTAGYDASVDYVAGVLRDNGFDVSTPEFDRLVVAEPGKPTLTVAGRNQPVDQAVSESCSRQSR